jgi:hypothetical protein
VESGEKLYKKLTSLFIRTTVAGILFQLTAVASDVEIGGATEGLAISVQRFADHEIGT